MSFSLFESIVTGKEIHEAVNELTAKLENGKKFQKSVMEVARKKAVDPRVLAAEAGNKRPDLVEENISKELESLAEKTSTAEAASIIAESRNMDVIEVEDRYKQETGKNISFYD